MEQCFFVHSSFDHAASSVTRPGVRGDTGFGLSSFSAKRDKKAPPLGRFFSGPRSGAEDLGPQPGTGVSPVTVGRAWRDSQNLRRLLAGQAGEVAQLDKPGFE